MSHEPCPEQEAADGKGVTAMPEAPDLEVIRDFLAPRIVGEVVTSARVIRPSVIRPLAGDFATLGKFVFLIELLQ